MKFYRLLIAACEFADDHSSIPDRRIPRRVFKDGAFWMYQRLVELDPDFAVTYDPTMNYGFYGFGKYLICLLAFGGTVWFAGPLAVLVFYLVEVHFLFLFPLLIDGVKQPLLKSICATYRIGLLRCTFTVMPIGAFMLIGLLNFRHPLRNWYLGCLSILIWYVEEVRDRTSS